MTRDEASKGQRIRAGGLGLWLRWSWRDLRARWVQVAAIALVVALGAGTYAGLGSGAAWRTISYDASYSVSDAHDLQVTLEEGSTATEEQLRSAVERVEGVDEVSLRLVVPTQIDVIGADPEVLVPGRLEGVEVVPGAGGPTVDRLTPTGGRALTPDDSGAPVAVLDVHLPDARDLPDTGTIRISGGAELEVVGTALAPQHFLVLTDTGVLFAQSGYGIAYVPLATAQALSGQPDAANLAAVRVADGADPAEVADRVDAAVAEGLPGATATVEVLTEEQGYRLLYDDIENDQRMFNVFAGLILGGAAFAAFNLTGRVVEAQRREIGVGLALGVPSRLLAVRPLLMSGQVALLGAALGVGVGLVVGVLLGDVQREFFPLPVWETPFQPGRFAAAAGLAVVLVVGAAAWPVARAVGVDPIDALRTGPRQVSTGGLARRLRRLPLPGGSVAQLPVRNVARAPRRTLLTALGIAAMVATLVAVLGMVDSFRDTIDRAEVELARDAPDRIVVTLQGFEPEGAGVTTELASVPGTAEVVPFLRVGGTLSSDRDEFETLLDVVDLDADPGAPALSAGAVTEEPGLVIAEEAARDLGLTLGDTVTFRHPRRVGLGYEWVTSELPVSGTHAIPLRNLTFLDESHAPLLALEGIVNAAVVVPDGGTDPDALVRSTFEVDGVGAVEPVAAITRNVSDLLDEVLGVLNIVTAAVLLLAVLIAFNSSAIASDERAREHATMFAFGLPVRTVLGTSVAESAIVGVIGTVLGLVAGRLLLGWMTRFLIQDTIPDLEVVASLSASTLLVAGGLGIVAVALAPLLTGRRLRRMDVPATLRVVE